MVEPTGTIVYTTRVDEWLDAGEVAAQLAALRHELRDMTIERDKWRARAGNLEREGRAWQDHAQRQRLLSS